MKPKAKRIKAPVSYLDLEARPMKPLVLFHGGCQDGWCAAWAAWRRFGDAAEYRAVQYGDDPPADDLDGRDVYILDFSYPLDAMERIAKASAQLVLLDHHKTAYDALLKNTPRGFGMVCKANDTITIVQDRSGAQLAWDHFHEGQPRPWIIDYVADRDLWQWKLPDSREVNAYLGSLPHDFAVWNRLVEFANAAIDPMFNKPPDLFVAYGQVILQARAREIERAVKRARRMMLTTGQANDIPAYALGVIDSSIAPLVVNATENMSEVLNQLAREPPGWAIGWFQDETGRYSYSLRSSEQGPDVSAIAKAFGGGGHAKAAGFEADRLLF